jgi:hypothetical protein
MGLKVNVGDFLQYRFINGATVSRDCRRVEMIDNKGFRVKGGYHVKPADVLAVIPPQESGAGSQELGGNPTVREGAGDTALSEAITREFPLEVGQ